MKRVPRSGIMTFATAGGVRVSPDGEPGERQPYRGRLWNQIHVRSESTFVINVIASGLRHESPLLREGYAANLKGTSLSLLDSA